MTHIIYLSQNQSIIMAYTHRAHIILMDNALLAHGQALQLWQIIAMEPTCNAYCEGLVNVKGGIRIASSITLFRLGHSMYYV